MRALTTGSWVQLVNITGVSWCCRCYQVSKTSNDHPFMVIKIFLKNFLEKYSTWKEILFSSCSHCVPKKSCETTPWPTSYLLALPKFLLPCTRSAISLCWPLGTEHSTGLWNESGTFSLRSRQNHWNCSYLLEESFHPSWCSSSQFHQLLKLPLASW